MKSKAFRQQGLTLIELLMVLAVLSITLGLSGPDFKAMLQERRLEGAATEVMADLQYVRSETVARNRTIRIDFSQDATGTCYVIHAGGLCTCTAQGTAHCDADATLIKTYGLPADSGLHLAANTSSIVVEPIHGTFTPTATLRFAAGDMEIHHIVNLLGRVRSCSPRGAVRGYPPC